MIFIYGLYLILFVPSQATQLVANIVWDIIFSVDAIIFLVMWYRAFDEAKKEAEQAGEATSAVIVEPSRYTRRGTIYMGAKGIELDMIQDGNPLYTKSAPYTTAPPTTPINYSTAPATTTTTTTMTTPIKYSLAPPTTQTVAGDEIIAGYSTDANANVDDKPLH